MEMQSTSNQSQMGFNLSQSQSSSAEISAQQLEKMVSLVMNAAESINRPKLKNLALIRESPRSLKLTKFNDSQKRKEFNYTSNNSVCCVTQVRGSSSRLFTAAPQVRREDGREPSGDG